MDGACAFSHLACLAAAGHYKHLACIRPTLELGAIGIPTLVQGITGEL